MLTIPPQRDTVVSMLPGYVSYFCLNCERNHDNDPYNADQDTCPYCGSENIVEDNLDDEYEIEEIDGHYEGDMGQRKHDNELE